MTHARDGTPARPSGRFGRTLSRARWPEYPVLLDAALSAGYRIVTLETFLGGAAEEEGPPLLILRHDVDQDARSALRMLRYEQERGVASTWYFRWRTADPGVVTTARDAGGTIGLHYETLTRHVLTHGRTDSPEALVAACRDVLKAEIAAFHARFGPTRSAAAHGDTRVPGVSNADLLRGQDPRPFGIEWDANDAMRRHSLACWMTDRSRAQGSWAAGVEPLRLLADRATPILCLTHPNNWTAGWRLWVDRVRHSIRDSDHPPL